MKIKRSLTALLAAGAMIVGASTQASAVSYGFVSFEVSNLEATFSSAATPEIGFGSTFAFRATTNAFLSPGPSESFVDSASQPFSCDRLINCPVAGTTGGPVDPAQAFAGAGGPEPAENTFTPVGFASPSYARADHLLNDTLINTAGCAGTQPGTPCAVAGFGGDFDAVAETAITGALTGSGSSGNTQTWDFGAVLGATHVHLEFDLDTLLRTSITQPGEDSSAEWSITFTMQAVPGGGGTTQSVSIGQNSTSIVPGPGQELDEGDLILPAGFTQPGGPGTPIIVDFDVVAGDYEFKITATNQATAASLAVVPQPMSLALLGLGLTGLGALAGLRNRRKSS